MIINNEIKTFCAGIIRAVIFLHFLIFEVNKNGKDTFDQSRFHCFGS